MKNYRARLPQTNGNIFLTDGGIETTLIFLEGIELPCFAAFDLLKDASGRDILRRYFETYAALAVRARTGFILETPTWRASRDWGHKLSYSDSELAEANRRAIEMMVDIREEFQLPTSSIVISGCIGPRGDGYQADVKMDVNEAAHYHEQQIRTFSDTAADMITGVTITYPEEAIGITLAAQLRTFRKLAVSFIFCFTKHGVVLGTLFLNQLQLMFIQPIILEQADHTQVAFDRITNFGDQ